MESKRVTYLAMKKHDRLTLKQGRAVLKALAEVDTRALLSGQDKPKPAHRYREVNRGSGGRGVPPRDSLRA